MPSPYTLPDLGRGGVSTHPAAHDVVFNGSIDGRRVADEVR